MGKLYAYEWKKLFRQRSFLFFTVILFFGNLILLFQYEKQTDAYTYFYQQKQEWVKFHKGDITVSSSNIYQSFVEKEEEYVSSYDNFLKQIPEQAKKLKETANYKNKNTYLYRNLEKTVCDYEGVSTERIKAEPSIGIKELANYNYGIYFQFIFLIVLSYFLIFLERKKGLFLLTKGTKQGHLPLAAAKVMTMISASALYGVLQECSTFLLLNYFYGYGDLNRSIQSVSIFRDCSLSITVAQAFVGLFLVRICVGIFSAVLIISLAIIFRKEGIALILYGVFIGIQMFLNYSIGISSSLNIIKCVNVFFSWDMKNIFGIYQNLNIFGYPVSKSVVILVLASIFIFMLVILSIYRFSFSCQISSGNLLEEIQEKISKRTSFMWHHTSVYRFELRKVFFQQKKGFLFIFLFIWCIISAKDALKPVYYDEPALGEYHKILEKISGSITQESLTYISEQRAQMDAIYEELEAVKKETTQEAEIKKQALQHEVEMRDAGVTLVEEQRDLLLQKDGDILKKYWIDEKKYIDVFYDYKYDLTAFFIAVVALVLWISDIETSDYRKGLYALLGTTKAGKRKIQKRKKLVCITGMGWCLICMLVPQFLRYYNIDQFQSTAQKLSDFTSLGFMSSMCVGNFLALLLVIKILVFVIVCSLLVRLSRKVSNASMIVGAGVGAIALVTLLLWYFHVDLTVLILHML